MRVIFMAAAAAFLLSACQTTEAPGPVAEAPVSVAPVCEPHSFPTDRVHAFYERFENTTWVELAEIPRLNLMAHINALEPPTQWVSVAAYFVYGRTAGAAIVDLDTGCSWSTGVIGLNDLQEFLRAAQGVGV